MRIFAFSCVLLLATVAAAQEKTERPTQAQIVATYDKKEYQECLKQLAQVLPLTGKAAEGYDRFALLNIKGECLLQTKQKDPAGYAFAEAAKATKNDKDAATALATSLLIKRSEINGYKPKTGDNHDLVPIVDPAARPAALSALWNDERSVAADRVKDATRGKSLPGIANAAKSLSGLDVLELAATSTTAKTEAMAKSLADHAGTVIDSALDADDKSIAAIEKSAKEYIEIVVDDIDPRTKKKIQRKERVQKGLSDQDKRKLEEIVDTSIKISSAVQDLQRLFGKAGAGLKTHDDHAGSVKKKAREVLTYRYDTDGKKSK